MKKAHHRCDSRHDDSDQTPKDPDQTTDDSGSVNSILFNIDANGAGPITAGYDNLPASIESSIAMAMMDIEAVFQFADRFEIAGEKFDLPPALLAAIASRESRGGTGLDANGEGDGGNAVGIMQIDRNWHDTADIGPDFASQEHIDQAASILDWSRDEADATHPEWSDAISLQAGTSAYNGGPEVFDFGIGNFDEGTDGGDYSNDVIARAQFYAENWDLLA